jgi:hypothetical protein
MPEERSSSPCRSARQGASTGRRGGPGAASWCVVEERCRGHRDEERSAVMTEQEIGTSEAHGDVLETWAA